MKFLYKESRRAKWVRLIISAAEGLTVVVPLGYDISLIPELLLKKSNWINKHNRRLKKSPVFPTLSRELPKAIELKAMSETWTVQYLTKNTKSVKTFINREESIITLAGNVRSRKLCRLALMRWLQGRAKDHFLSLTSALASEHGFTYNKLTVRCQRRRWGSCSSKGNISLNLKLLFFPPEIVSYVVLHELCHTIEMNHSRHFWALVHEKLPHYPRLHRLAKDGSQFVPEWL